jgi:hypothetical protein
VVTTSFRKKKKQEASTRFEKVLRQLTLHYVTPRSYNKCMSHFWGSFISFFFFFFFSVGGSCPSLTFRRHLHGKKKEFLYWFEDVGHNKMSLMISKDLIWLRPTFLFFQRALCCFFFGGWFFQPFSVVFFRPASFDFPALFSWLLNKPSTVGKMQSAALLLAMLWLSNETPQRGERAARSEMNSTKQKEK